MSCSYLPDWREVVTLEGDSERRGSVSTQRHEDTRRCVSSASVGGRHTAVPRRQPEDSEDM